MSVKMPEEWQLLAKQYLIALVAIYHTLTANRSLKTERSNSCRCGSSDAECATGFICARMRLRNA